MKRLLSFSLLAALLATGGVVAWRAFRSSPARVAPAASVAAAPQPDGPTTAPAPAATAAGKASEVKPADALARFREWSERFAQADAAARGGLLAEGVAAAQARRAALVALMKADPERALQEALPYAVRKRLPAEILREVEQPLTASGRFNTTFFCDPEHKHPGDHPAPERTFRTADAIYTAHVYGWREQVISHDSLLLHGIALDGHMAASAEPARVVGRDEADDLVAAGVTQRQGVCRVCGAALNAATAVLLDLGGGEYHTTCARDVKTVNDGLQAGVTATVSAQRAAQDLLAGYEGEFWDQFRALPQFTQPAQYFGASSSATVPPSGIVGTGYPGQRRLLLIPAQFADEPGPPITQQAADIAGRQVGDRFTSYSYGFMQVYTTVTPPVTLPQRMLYYDEAGAGTIVNDAVAAAARLGYISTSFDVPIPYVITTPIPAANYGGISSGLVFGTGALVHEIGHNLGLGHADYLDNSLPNNPTQPNPALPFDTDSQVGHPDINAPFVNTVSSPVGGGNGDILEYGDRWDTMGGGGSDFSVAPKLNLGWLPRQAHRIVVNKSETNRIYAFDQGGLTNGRLYSLQVQRRNSTTRNGGPYYLSHRRAITDNQWLSEGLLVQHGTTPTLLLDTTPGTPDERDDAPIACGRTFADPEARLFITPVNRGGTGGDAWVDVVTHRGPFPGNNPPVISAFTPSAVNVAAGATVTFTTVASDPDGDTLAYHYEYSDGTFTYAATNFSRTFTAAGNYVVRCEVSDMKGGVDSTHVLIRVGAPATFNISGRVVDGNGVGVPNIRVHNGISPVTAAGYRHAFTDARGYYTIPNLAPGTYELSGYAYRRRTQPLNYNFGTVVVGAADLTGVDLISAPLSHVSVAVLTNAQEFSNTPGAFRISRTGPATNEITVRYSAVSPEGLLFTLSPASFVTLSNGVTFADVTVTPQADTVGDGARSVVLTLQMAAAYTNLYDYLTNDMIIQLTNVTTVPGWERRPRLTDGATAWFQTYPNYVLGDADATMFVADDDTPVRPTISLTRVNPAGVVVEGSRNAGGFVVTRSGSLIDTNLNVHLTWTGTATNGVDYLPLPTNIVIRAGETFTIIPVIPVNNGFVDGNRTVTCNPQAAPGYNASSAQSLTIADDDRPAVTVYAADPQAARGGGNNGQWTFVRIGDLDGDLEVNYVLGGTGVPGVDYNALSGKVTIPAGLRIANVTLTPTATGSSPGNKTADLIIADAATYNIFGDGRATVRIADTGVPTVTVANGGNATEGGAAGAFTITRTGAATNDLVVFYRVGGTANANSDYAGIGTNVTLPAGSASVSIPITPVNDNFREFTATGQNNNRLNEHEYVELALLPADTYIVGNNSSARVTLTDDDNTDFPMVGFMQPGQVVREDAGLVRIPVRIAGNPTNQPSLPIVINWSVTGGTAILNSNYAGLTSGQLLFVSNAVVTGAADVTSQNQFLSFTMLNDNVLGPDRTLIVTLDYYSGLLTNGFVTNIILVTNGGIVTTNLDIQPLLDLYPTNAVIADYKQHTLVIEDINRANVSIAAVNATAREAGAQPGTIRISHTGNTATPVTVKLFTDGSAVAGADFVPLPSEVTIPAGTNAIVLSVVPIDDVLEEEPESVRVQIIQTPDVRVTASSAQVTILSNDGTVQFTGVNFSAFEGAGNAAVTVIRTGDTNELATVDYAITGGSAVNGVDYLGTNGTLTFLPGQTLRTILLPLLDDAGVEPDKTVEFTLSNVSGGAPLGGQDTATLTIRDDDQALQFALGTFAAYENATNAVVVVQRRGLTNTPATVVFSTADGTANNGVDYTGQTNTLSFAIGETSKTLLIPLTNDVLFEADETVLLSLTGVTGTNATLGTFSNAVLTIVEDETRFEFASAAQSAAEYAGFAPVVVRRLGGTEHAVTVGFRALNVTASNSFDFNQPSATVAFAGDQVVALTNGSGQTLFVPGQTERTILVPLLDDVIGEGNETFQLQLTNAAGPGGLPAGTVLLGALTNTTVTIFDDELPGNVDFNYNPVINPSLTNSGLSTTVAGTVRDAANGSPIPGASLVVGGVPLIAGPGGVFTVPNVPVGPLAVTADAGGYASFSGSFPLAAQPTNAITVPLTPAAVNALYLFTFETGLQGFAISNNVGTGRGLWHRSTGRGFNLGHSASNSLYYGTNETVTGGGNYDVGDNEGAVISPLLDLSNAVPPLALSFNYLLATEGNSFFDFALVEISTNNGLTYAPLLNANAGGAFANNTLGQWRSVTNDLSAYAGRSVRLRFRFDTGDAILNNFEGWYVDDIAIVGAGGASNQAPFITQQPLDAAVVPGNTGLFSVFANGTAPLSFQWRKGGAPLPAQTNALLVLPAVGAADVGGYDCVVSNAYGVTTSTVAALTLANFVQACGNGVAGGLVYALGIDAFDNKAVLGGNFGTVNGVAVPRVARLTPQGLLDTSFAPGSGPNSNVWAVAVQPDSKVLIGGDFTSVSGTARTRVARLLFNGAVDFGFNVGAGANGRVNALTVQPDGKVLVGGDFTAFAGSASNAFLVRLNGDGSVDTNFAASVNGPVQAIAVATNGRVYIGGCFTSAGGLARARLAALSGTNGAADPAFNPGAGTDGVVRTIALPADGRVLIGGAFSLYDNAPVGYLARLNPDGTRDTTFAAGAGADAPVNALVAAPQGKIFVAGAFRTFDALPRAGYARLRPDGSVDAMFDVGTGADGPVYAAVGQTNSAFVIGGNFGFVNGLPRTGVARIRGDETSNISIIELSAVNYTVVENAGPAVITLLRSGNTNGTVSILLSTTNGTAVTPGDYAPVLNSNVVFTPGQTLRTVSITITNDTAPEPDETFGVRLSGATLTTLIGALSNATVTIRDDEQSVRFSATNYAAQEGSNVVITIFRQGLATNTVSVSFAATNGTATAPGDFTALTNVVTLVASQTVATVTVPTFADGVSENPETINLRLFAPAGVLLAAPSNAVLTVSDFLFVPGSLDTNFNPGAGANNFVRSVAFQPDGKLLAGGAFTQMNGTNRNYIARLHGSGALDLGFDPGAGPDAAVAAVAVAGDGRVFLGGSFSNVNGARFNRVARMDTNGATPAGFSSPFTLDAALNTLTLRGDGRLLIGGTFSIPTIGVTRLTGAGLVESAFAPAPGLNGPVHDVVPGASNQVYVAGGFTSFGGFALGRLTRLNDDGSVDLTYVPADISGGVVFALALQADGKLVLGGSFTTVGGSNRVGIARLNANGSLDTNFNPGLGFNAPVYDLALQPNGKLVAGGAFTSYDGAPAGRYVRLLDTGARDPAFDSSVGADDVVYSVAVARGRVALGGNFTTVNGLARRGVALLRADPGAPRFTQSSPALPPFTSQLESDAGVTYLIEATTDFATWTPILTNTASGPLLPVVDPNAGVFPQRFYRSRVLAP